MSTITGGDHTGVETASLLAQITDLRDALEAIRRGGVDAVITGEPGAEQVYTLSSADRPYRLIIEQMNEGALTVSPSGVILYANPRLGQMLGRGTSSLVGTDIAELVVHADQQLLTGLLQVSVNGCYRVEVRLKSTDGALHVLLAASCLDLEGTTVICLVVTDLTVQKQVEGNLRESESRLAQFLDAVPVGITIADQQGRPHYTNREAHRLLGSNPDPASIDGRSNSAPVSAGHFGYRAGTSGPYPSAELPQPRALAGEATHIDDLTIETPAGVAVPVEAWGTPVRGLDGIVEYGITALVDISERQRTQQVIAEQAAMLDLAHDAVIVSDADGRITYWNRGAERTYGYSREHALGAVVHDLLRTRLTESWDVITARLASDGQWESEVEQTTADGRTAVVATRWAYHWSIDGSLLGIMEINRDVTARRAAEAEVARRTVEQQELLDELASTEARERVILAEAVHDDPLQLVVAALLRIDDLQLRIRLPPAEGAALDHIATLLEQSVDRLRKLIVAMTPLDVSDGLGVALHGLASGIFVGTATSVDVKGPTHVHLSVQATTAAYRIMREALVNARKHAGATHVVLTLHEDPEGVLLTLTDDGAGTDSLESGPGHLGIATMRARAQADGADLTIDSRPGAGTRVSLRIPAGPAPG
jgi:PAS domain S-box-containing protein